MPVEGFLDNYRNTLANKKIINPLKVAPTDPFQMDRPEQPGMGSSVPGWLQTRKSGALDAYMSQKQNKTSAIASDYASKAAGQIPTNEFGQVERTIPDFQTPFTQQIKNVTEQGQLATQTEEAKAQWQALQGQKEMNAGYTFNWGATAGASGDNAGAKAVQLAMNTFNSGTPYAWGGNSLTKGVDCSGLVQQIYGQLGIKIPRQTYEQAKSGKRVSLDQLLPGDLLFFNSGSGDPNGIGVNGHVGIYIGNGQMIDARNTRAGIKMGSINIMGGPTSAVRPW